MVRVPTFTLLYEGVDITEDIKPLTQSIDFIDKIDGKESDEVSITVDNSDLRWLDSWLPKEGDNISLQLGYKDESPMLGPVGFQVDEPEWSGAPDVLVLKGQATPVKSSLRQKNSTGYEDVTLKELAETIAKKHNLTIVSGDKLPEVKLDRITQRNQTDLEFLQQQASEFGVLFKIDSASRLVFYLERELEAAAAVMTIKRTECADYQLRRGAIGTYSGVKFQYLSGKSGDYTEVSYDAKGKELVTQQDGKDEVATQDVLVIKERFSTRSEGELRAKEALRKANRGAVEGNIELEGIPTLSAGLNVTLQGFGKMGGKYQIKQARHSITRSGGYKLSLELTGLETYSDVQPVTA